LSGRRDAQSAPAVRSADLEALGDRARVTLRHVFAGGATRDACTEHGGGLQGAIETTIRQAEHPHTMPGAT
jgi:hypothetical protein